jgi:hypothetical protein
MLDTGYGFKLEVGEAGEDEHVRQGSGSRWHSTEDGKVWAVFLFEVAGYKKNPGDDYLK